MQQKRYTEEQIIGILKEAASGVPAVDVCRKHGVSTPSFYKWRAKYAGLEVSDLRKMKGLESENQKLKRIVADLTLDNMALKELASKNW